MAGAMFTQRVRRGTRQNLCSFAFDKLRPRMKLSMDFFQPRLVDMRVNLSRRDAGVPQHLLHLP